MNLDLARLHSYPFNKLAALKEGLVPPADMAPIALSIGEPRHPPPDFVVRELVAHLDGLSLYPSSKGLVELRQAIARWITRRFSLPTESLDPERHVLPVSGTREALFSFAQVIVDRTQSHPLVLMPNPFYQIYEGAALLAGAEPHYLNCLEENGFIPNFDAVPAEVWQRCQLLYICTPGNPTGAVMSLKTMQQLIALADEHDFVIASDECYSEIYADEASPPPGLLQACAAMGRTDYRRCVIFHSLSKRSNLPGLRSGFVAGDAAILERYLLYRTYHGCAMAVPSQLASIVAWNDEQHVRDNRALYRNKLASFLAITGDWLDAQQPDAGFYLWPRLPLDGERFAEELFRRHHVTVLPGAFLGRDAHGVNPGHDRVRIAMVAEPATCDEAAYRVRACLEVLVDALA